MEYTRKAGIEGANRALLDRLHRAAKGPFTAAEAGQMLEIPEARARRLLRYLYARGWLSRVKRGLYVTVPLGAPEPSDWRADPWVVAVSSFSPCYIAGWSACEHWGLTEQIFRTVLVATGRRFRRADVEVQSTPFRLRRMPADKHFGTHTVWRGQTRVPVSDPSRTVIDILDDPRMGGGMRHIAEVLQTYWSGEHRNDGLLLQYGKTLDNRTVFKRLGYLLEALELDADQAIGACQERLSAGVSTLDPSSAAKGTIHKRWNLRVNVSFKGVG
jgi:predicted transcriptional regulator of viral defense system